MTCLWFELLCRIPVAGIQLRMSRRHLLRCPRCRQESERDASLPPILVTADRVAAGLDLWPAVKRGIMAHREPAAGPDVSPLPARRSWRWAAAAAMASLLVATGLWILLQGKHPGPLPEPPRDRPSAQTRLCSAKIADRPARVFQVQSRNPDRTIFWIARNNTRS